MIVFYVLVALLLWVPVGLNIAGVVRRERARAVLKRAVRDAGRRGPRCSCSHEIGDSACCKHVCCDDCGTPQPEQTRATTADVVVCAGCAASRT